jgi:hypothetical protein
VEGYLLIWFIAVGIAVVIIIIYVIWYYDNQRLKALKRLAESLNFTFSKKSNESMLEVLGRFHLFSQGHSRSISNVFSGMFNDIPVMVMDYKYTTGGGKSSHTWQQTVLAFESDKLLLPSFVLRPENLFDKIGGVFGKKDINIESAPVFSKRYLLRGNDEESIRKLFKEWVFQYYEQHPGLSTEGDGKKLIYYRSSKRVSPDKIQVFLQEGYDVFGLFKGH